MTTPMNNGLTSRNLDRSIDEHTGVYARIAHPLPATNFVRAHEIAPLEFHSPRPSTRSMTGSYVGGSGSGDLPMLAVLIVRPSAPLRGSDCRRSTVGAISRLTRPTK